MPGVHRDLVADRTVDDRNRRERGRAARSRGDATGGQREDHREVLGPRTRHDGVDRHFLHGEFPRLAEHRRTEPSDDLVRRMARPLEHRLDARLRRQHDRQHVGPVVLFEQPLEVVLGIGLHQPRCRPLERQALEIRILERGREAVEHLLHEGAPGDRVAAVDVRTQMRGRLIDDRMRRVRLTQARHPHGERGRLAEPRESLRMYGDRGHAVLFQRRGEPDDRRATGASKTDAENRGVAVSGDGRAHLRIVCPGLLRSDDARIDRGQVLIEPVLQLLHEHR